MLCKVAITIESVDKIPVVLFIMMYTVALTFESTDEILKCDHSNESYLAVLSCGGLLCCIIWF